MENETGKLEAGNGDFWLQLDDGVRDRNKTGILLTDNAELDKVIIVEI
jgi:hypothetical protein